jgi:hypothetical protein
MNFKRIKLAGCSIGLLAGFAVAQARDVQRKEPNDLAI